MIYGDFGVGKDTFANTFRSPIPGEPDRKLVIFTDGKGGNEFPYFEGATEIGEIQTYECGEDYFGEPILIEYQDIIKPNDGLTRIEFINSPIPENPYAADIVKMKFQNYTAEQKTMGWNTLIMSSLSTLSIESMNLQRHILNPESPTKKVDKRQWYGATKEYLTDIFSYHRTIKGNVLYIAHTGLKDDNVSGEIIRQVALPGSLGTQSGMLVGECYRVFVERDKATKKRKRWLQTDNDGKFSAKSHLKCESPIEPNYEALWHKWDQL
jgi:hypothetical protein